MRIWADVYNLSGNRLGSGSINTLLSVSVRRVLDGAGSMTLTVPASDQRAIDLLKNERLVRVYVHQIDTRELGTFIIQKRPVRINESGSQMSISGASQLQEVARKSVLLGRKYDNLTLNDIVDNLIGLCPGWSAITDSSMSEYTIRGDGVSVLKMLVTLAEQTGHHLREGTGRTLEFGKFGTATGIRAIGGNSTVSDIKGKTLLIDSIQVEEDTTDIVNWIIPLAAGEGDTAITLEKSTRTAPYPIQTVTYPDGRTGYYIADASSISTYGQNERIIKFSNIAPLENSDTAIERAANALYDAAAARLQRSSQKQESYSITCVRVTETIRPGDKLHISYQGLAETTAGEVVYLHIRDDFWVMQVEERIGTEGIRLNLKVNKIDQMQIDSTEEIVGALEEMEVQQTSIKNYVVTRPILYVRQIDPTHPAIIPVRLTDATLSLVRCKVWIRTRSFRSTAKAAASGGGATSSAGGSHRHLVFKSQYPAVPEYSLTGVLGRSMLAARASGSTDLTAAILASPDRSDIYTYDASGDHTHTMPAHTHSLQYGITDDTQTPEGISIKLNGVDLTTAKGGPWMPSGGAGVFEFVLTDEIINATGGLRQEHQLEVSCTGGQGEIEAGVENMEVVQTLAI